MTEQMSMHILFYSCVHGNLFDLTIKFLLGELCSLSLFVERKQELKFGFRKEAVSQCKVFN